MLETDHPRLRPPHLIVLLALAVTMAGSGCSKNDMAYQASIRPWQSAEQPADGTVPVSGIEPRLTDGEAIDTLPNPVPADTASIERGLALFADHCVACHGPGVTGTAPSRRNSTS